MAQILGTGFSDELRHKRRPMRIAIQHSTEKLGHAYRERNPLQPGSPLFQGRSFRKYGKENIEQWSQQRRGDAAINERESLQCHRQSLHTGKAGHTHESGKKQRQEPGVVIVQTQKENRKTYQ